MTGALVPAFSSPTVAVAAVPRDAAVAVAPAQADRLSTVQDLVRGFLLSKRSATTRAAYTADLASWLHWCTQLELDPLRAGIHHADAYLRLLTEVGDPRTGRTLAASSVARRTSAVHGFYRYAARHGAVTGSPFTGITRPAIDEESMTSGLTRDEVHALFAAARAHTPRSEALVKLLVLNGLRVSEALGARIEDLDHDQGHRVLRIRRKGGRRARVPLTPDVQHALAGATGHRTAGPLFATTSGRALDRTAAWRLLRRLAADAGLPAADRISPHSARHTYATTALDAGVALRDVQDSMGHRDPRTTRLYDRTRANHTRNATYAVAAALAD